MTTDSRKEFSEPPRPVYRIRALNGDAEWIEESGITSLEQAERVQAKLYASYAGMDFVIEHETGFVQPR